MTEQIDNSQQYEELPPGISVHRVIQPHCNKVDEGRPSSACLLPSKKDEGKLSVDRSDQHSPEQSYQLFVGLGYKAVGVITVSHESCDRFRLKRYAWPLPDNKAHSFIDFRGVSQSVPRKLFNHILESSGNIWSYRTDSA